MKVIRLTEQDLLTDEIQDTPAIYILEFTTESGQDYYYIGQTKHLSMRLTTHLLNMTTKLESKKLYNIYHTAKPTTPYALYRPIKEEYLNFYERYYERLLASNSKNGICLNVALCGTNQNIETHAPNFKDDDFNKEIYNKTILDMVTITQCEDFYKQYE